MGRFAVHGSFSDDPAAEAPGPGRAPQQTLVWSGGVDDDNADRRAAELVAALNSDAEAVHLDLTRVTELNHRGTSILVGCLGLARGNGVPLTFSASSDQVRSEIERLQRIESRHGAFPSNRSQSQPAGSTPVKTEARIATYRHGPGFLASLVGPLSITNGWITIGNCPVVFPAADVDWNCEYFTFGKRTYVLGDAVDVGGGWVFLSDLRKHSKRLSVPDHWDDGSRVFAAN